MNQYLDAHTLPADRWRQDASLHRAAELIERDAARLRAVTLDFFDTLAWRLAAEPTDVFVEVGHRLREAGHLPAHISPRDYEVLRRQAESKARHRQVLGGKTREDVTLAEILQELKTIVPNGGAAAEIELAAECDFCALNPHLIDFARHVRQRGLKLFIVSDIYLSAGQLRTILRANQFDPVFFDGIFTSSEEGVCKTTGNLFARVLQKTGLKPEEIMHVGDNIRADVAGARKAGVRGHHYVQASPETRAMMEREEFLLGSRQPAGSVNSLRRLAARSYSGDTEEDFFGRAGALLLGPLLARYASWACEQFAAAGIRKIGAFMREGEILGQLLRQEAVARGLELEVEPLYVNRRSTDLAALGTLTADTVVGWLTHRQTLSVKAILEQFGLRPAELRNLPLGADEKLSSPERIIEFAKYLFRPEIARRIEQRSAEERRKVMDYLRPWLEAGNKFGVCDIGYNATAQMQLKRIFELERCRSTMLGCYLVTCERAAQRVLDGLDARHFLGAFGNPGMDYAAFLRSPAFVEQSLVAACGTTLGYERGADGLVRPILDEMRFSPELLRRQRAFKEGVLYYQNLWLHVRGSKPGVLDGASESSRRLLADIDLGCGPILARAAAFPTQEEIKHFGSLPLDDYYFAEGVKTICGPKDREFARIRGYAGALTQQAVLWPQGVFHAENSRTAAEFFSCGKAMLCCDVNGERDTLTPAVTVIVRTGKKAAQLRECLGRVRSLGHRDLPCEILLLAAEKEDAHFAVAGEFGSKTTAIRFIEPLPNQTPIQQFNAAADVARAPLVLLLDDGVLLPAGWDGPLLNTMAAPDAGLVLLPGRSRTSRKADLDSTARCLFARRSAFVESLGLKEQLSLTGAVVNLALNMRAQKWQVVVASAAATEVVTGESAAALNASDRKFLANRCPDPAAFISSILAEGGRTEVSTDVAPVKVDWIGSFADAGSLSHVNRALTGALQAAGGLRIVRVSNGAAVAAGFEKLAREISRNASDDAAVTVRQAWPPDWTRPRHGKLAVIQPWEFGRLPEQWVQAAADVDEFWVPSEYVRRVYVESGVPAVKVAVVPNGVDTEKFCPQAAPMKLATQKRFKFLFLGGTIFRKGPDLLLQAYLENFTAADDVCLVIKDFGGQSVYAGQTIEAKIRAAQAQPDAPEILYLNEEFPAETLPGLYTACQCLVLPYRGEGFGLPVLEAMACGVPVMVTAGGATDDFVRGEFAWRIPAARVIFGKEISGLKLSGDGWLLEPEVGALGRFMREAFANPADAQRRGQLAARHAQRAWTWKNAAAIAGQRIARLAAAKPLGKAGILPPHPDPLPRGEGTAGEHRSLSEDGQAAPDSWAQGEHPIGHSQKKVVITLPPCALVGHLGEARELARQKKLPAAWEATRAALARRPFHPEAFLELAEIAFAAGDGPSAKLCAEHARQLAPGWKPAKKFLNQRLKGGAKPEWLKLPASLNSQPSTLNLTVCLIVKNEEKFLGQCLKSVRPVASQIVVVDTGSTDRTVEIAKEYGAEVHEFAWCEDFSAARNAALEHATGDWVLMLDADEELSAEGAGKLAAAMAQAAVMAWRLPMVDAGHEVDGVSYVPRLFRNAPGLFYLGRVHEQVFSSIEVRRGEWGLENRLGDATLIHHGYTAELTRDRNKIERNLRLLERAIGELPDEPHLLMNYGLELARSGREAEALERYREAFRLLSSKPAAEVVPELRESLLTQLCTRLAAAKHFGDIISTLTSPLAGMNGGLTASQHFSLGLAYIELKQFREAADQMRQCLAKRGERGLSPINREITTAAPHHCLALSLAQSGDAAGAEKAFQEGLKEKGHGEALRIGYARLLAGQNRPVEALQQLHEVVNADGKHIEAWRLGGQIALSRPEFLGFARDWTHAARLRATDDLIVMAQRAEALTLSGETGAAVELWSKVWERARQPAVLAALILCEAVESPTTQSPDAQMEPAVSRAFIEWYRKLLAAKAQATVMRLNEQIDKLSRALPGAAKILETATAEARRACAVGVGS